MSAATGSMAAPADEAYAVTPSDSVNLAVVSRGLYVGVAGDVTVEMAKVGTTILFKGVPAGAWLPLRVSRVDATGTTATNIVAVC